MCRNGEVVEGADHSRVVQLIRSSGKEVNMVVISVSEEESRRLEPEGASNGNTTTMDYFERRSVPISVPDTEKVRGENGKEYVVFNIYLANKKVAAHRYREFDALNANVSSGDTGPPVPTLPLSLCVCLSLFLS